MADTPDDAVQVIVEIPRGSRNKYELDPETGRIELDRRIAGSLVYPVDYGYLPETHAEDGDEMDALVCVTEPTFPGCLIRTKPIALLRMHAHGVRNDKVLCVPLRDPAWSEYDEADELPKPLRTEIEHFFASYTEAEGHPFQVEGWSSRRDAVQAIAEGRDRHQRNR